MTPLQKSTPISPFFNLLALFAALLGPVALGQTSAPFAGQVVNSATQLPLENAVITLETLPTDGEAEFETTSGPFGFYRLPDVPFANYEFRVSHPAFLEHKETLNFTSTSPTNRKTQLLQVLAESVFDVEFQVYGLSTQVSLQNALVSAEYWKPDGTITGTADSIIEARTDSFGSASLRMLKDGFYKFTIKRSGWEDITYTPSPDIGPVVGESVRLIRDHIAAVFMKPKRNQFNVTVTGYDPIADLPNKPLPDAVLQLTGFDFEFDGVVLPEVTKLTTLTGQFQFTNLVPIPYELTVAKLGYEQTEFAITQEPDGSFASITTHLDLEPTKVRVTVDSPYETTEAVEGAKILLKGVLNSCSEGIDREMEASVSEDGATVSALFENLLPGRYWIHVVHEATISGLPGESGPLRNPTQFDIQFFPVETYVQVESGSTEELEITLEPLPAMIRGRIYATDEVARLDEELCFSEPHRVFHQISHDDIRFMEHKVVDLLDQAHKVVSVSTDESGTYTALVIPGIYGVQMPTLDNYTGHNIEFGNISAGQGPRPREWPYPDVWPYDRFEFGHHGGGLAFNSDDEYQLDFVVHRHYIHASGLVTDEGSPFGGLVLRMDPDGSNVETTPYDYLSETGGRASLSGTSTQSVPINANGRYLFRDLSPGSYTVTIDHPDFDSTPVEFTIAPWDAPGLIPSVAPFTPTYFFPGIVHCDFKFDIEAVYRHKGPVTIQTYRFDAADQDYNDTGTRFPNYFRATALGNALFRYSRTDSVPPGPYTIYSLIDDEWYTNSATGPAEFDGAVVGGPLDNTNLASSPAVASGGGSTIVGSLGTYEMDLHAVSSGDKSIEISGVSVEFNVGTPKPAGGVVQHEGTAYPSGASHAGMQWTYSFFPSPTVELIDPIARRVKVTVFMDRAMVISGKVQTPNGQNGKVGVPEAAVVIRSRNGAPIARTITDSNGNYSVGNFPPQPIYVDINRRGFIPIREKRNPGSESNPDLPNQIFDMMPVPSPTIDHFKMNRFGMFIPGVTKSGDSNIPGINTSGFNPENGRGKLTTTWNVKANTDRYDYSLTGFHDANNQQMDDEEFTINDEIAQVWIVDKRSFDAPFVNDPNQDSAVELKLPSPLNYATATKWLKEITSAKKDGEPYYVVHRVANRGKLNGNGEFEDKIQLWELPSGVFQPRAIVFTQNGGVAVKDYKPPMVGDKPANSLQGMTLPRWAASILEVVGTLANAPSLSVRDDLDDEEKNRRLKKVRNNFGDRFLRIGRNSSVAARIGLVPIDASPDNPDRVIFNPTEDILKTDLYLTYKYVIGVEMPLGEDTPQTGFLAMVSKKTGVTITGVDAEFEVSGGDNKACIALVFQPEKAPANEQEAQKKKEAEEAAKEDTNPTLAKRASEALGIEVKFIGPDTSFAVKFATCKEFGADNAGNNRIASYSGILEGQGTVEGGVEVNITPMIRFLPYGAVVERLNKTAKERFNIEAIRLDALFELLTGIKVTAEVTGTFPYNNPNPSITNNSSQPRPRPGDRDPMTSTPSYNFMGMPKEPPTASNGSGSNDGIDLDGSLEVKGILRAAVGLKLTVANGFLSGSGLVQLGAPKGASDTDGVFITFSPSSEYFIKKYEGAVSFVLRAKANFYITSISKSWQYDLLTFTVERASVPRFELTPLNTSTLIISPQTAAPSTFVGNRTTIVEDFYPAGSISVSDGETPLTVYTGTDPSTGEMTILASRSSGGVWQTPTEVARATGVVSTAGVELADGRFLVVWSEVNGTDLLDPYPSTTIHYAISNADASQWGAPQPLTISNEAMFDIQLATTDDSVLLSYFSTPDGPLAAKRSLWVSSFTNDQWTAPQALFLQEEILEQILSARGETGCLLATTTSENSIQEIHWNQGVWNTPKQVVSDADFPLDTAYDSNGDLVLFWQGIDGTLRLSRRSPTGSWTHFKPAIADSNATSLQIQPLQQDGQEVLLATYNQGTDRTDLRAAWFTADGALLHEPRPISFDATGSYHELQIRADSDSTAKLVALHSFDDQATIREFSLAFPSGTDCDADGIDDVVAIAAGLVSDCNENGVPDTCDLRFGTSTDLNKNRIPDECETITSPDCNGNGVADRDEIALGILADENRNGIPDSCEGDLPAPPTTEPFPTVRVITVTPNDFERYFRAENLLILGADPSTLILEYTGNLEEATSTAGPWTIVE